MNLIKKLSEVNSIPFLLINLLAIAIWAFQLCAVGFPNRAVMMNHTDAIEYVDVGNWLFGGPMTKYVATRTILFPLIFTSVTKIFGLKFFFIFQSLLWLAAINLLCGALLRILNHSFIAFMFAAIFSVNLSILAMTYEVLTETVAILFSCLTVYLITKWKSAERIRLNAGILLLILAVLTLIKPIFELVFIVVLVLFFFLLLKEKEMRNKKNWLLLFSSLLLIAVQVIVSFRYAGNLSVSAVGDLTLRRYLMAQTFCHTDYAEIDTARANVYAMSWVQLIQFSLQNFPELIRNYFHNLHFGVSSYPAELSAIGSPNFELNFMVVWNRFHWIAQLALPVALLISLRKIKSDKNIFWQVVILATTMYSIFLVIGISYGQADRLVLPAIPFVFVLYAILIKENFLGEKK